MFEYSSSSFGMNSMINFSSLWSAKGEDYQISMNSSIGSDVRGIGCTAFDEQEPFAERELTLEVVGQHVFQITSAAIDLVVDHITRALHVQAHVPRTRQQSRDERIHLVFLRCEADFVVIICRRKQESEELED